MSEKIKDVITLMVIIAIVIGGYFLIQYLKEKKELENQVVELQKNITTVENSNQVLKEAIEIKEQSSEITKDIINENKSLKGQQQINKEVIKNKAEILVKETKKVTADKLKNIEDPIEISNVKNIEDKLISEIRITSLWESYCLHEPNEEECRGVQT